MVKTDLTRKAERAVWHFTNKMACFRCFEVSLGSSHDQFLLGLDNQFIDFCTYEMNGDIRCYEIKTSVSDFHSEAKLTFVGHYNYLVIPKDLYIKLKKDDDEKLNRLLFQGVGVLCFDPDYLGSMTVERRPKKKTVGGGVRTMIMESMMRGLHREVVKFYEKEPYWNGQATIETPTPTQVKEQIDFKRREKELLLEEDPLEQKYLLGDLVTDVVNYCIYVVTGDVDSVERLAQRLEKERVDSE